QFRLPFRTSAPRMPSFVGARPARLLRRRSGVLLRGSSLMNADPSRRWLLGAAAAGVLAGLAGCSRPNSQTAEGGLVDLRGRPLGVTPPLSRLSVDDGRYLVALALIHPDPVSVLAAWSGDVHRISPEMYAA